MTSVPMNTIAEPYIRLRATYHLERKYVVIFAGGNGQPFVTTDYPSVQRALETNCDAILVAKHGVDGVLTGDPRKEKDVKVYKSLTYDHVLDNDLRVMDQSAILLARDFSCRCICSTSTHRAAWRESFKARTWERLLQRMFPL